MAGRLATQLLSLLLAVPVLAGPRFATRTIPVGNGPESMVLAPSLGVLFVALPAEGRVVVVRLADDEVVDGFATGMSPMLLALDEVRNRLIVVGPERVEAYERGPSGYFLAGATATQLQDPMAVAFDAAADRFLVVDYSFGRLSCIEGGDLAWNPAPTRTHQPRQVVAGPKLIVPGGEGGNVTLVGRADLTPEAVLTNPGLGLDAVYDPTRDRVYSIAEVVSWLYVADLGTGTDDLVLLDEAPGSIAFDAGRDTVFVGHHCSPLVVRVDGRDLSSRRIEMPSPAPSVILDPDLQLLYGVQPIGSQVSVLDTRSDSVAGTFALGEDPRRALLDPATHKLYTANYRGDSVQSLWPLADPGGSQVWTEPEYIAADASSRSLVSVRPTDAGGEPLGPGHDVVVAATAGTLIGSVDYLGDGLYAQELQSAATVETAIVSAHVDGVRLEDRPRVSFTQEGWANLREIEPEWGLTMGGEVVTLRGDGFSGGEPGTLEVRFDGVASPEIRSVSDTEIVCLTPAHAAGVIDVSVVLYQDDVGRESYLRGGFTYVEDAGLKLFATKGKERGEVQLVWSPGPSGPVRLLQSSSADFTSGVNEVRGLVGPRATDLAPAARTFYSIVR